MACIFQSNRLLCLFSTSLLKLIKLSAQTSSENRPTLRMKSGTCLDLKNAGGYIFSKVWAVCVYF